MKKFNIVLILNILTFFAFAAISTDKKTNSEANEQLMEAIKSGNYEKAKSAIKNGANVNMSDEWDTTPLEIASRERDPKFVKLLIDSNADVKQKTENGSTALHVAATRGKVDNMKLLISAGADVNAIHKLDNSTPLFNYMFYGPNYNPNLDLNLIQLFLNKGADLTLKATNNGHSMGPLEVASKFKHVGNMSEVLNILKDGQEKQRQMVQSEVSKYLVPGVANIPSEYIFGPKK